MRQRDRKYSIIDNQISGKKSIFLVMGNIFEIKGVIEHQNWGKDEGLEVVNDTHLTP